MPACNFDSYSNFAKARFHIQNLVLAKYFGDFITSQLAPLPTKLKTALSDGFKILVRAKGLEPSTSTLARLRSSQLSYARIAGLF